MRNKDAIGPHSTVGCLRWLEVHPRQIVVMGMEVRSHKSSLARYRHTKGKMRQKVIVDRLPEPFDSVVVPRAGVEPARPYGQRILSP